MGMRNDEIKEKIILGKWTEEYIDALLKVSWAIDDIADRISYLSSQLLNTGYEESTLIGNTDTPETFVINLRRVDCFTFLDYIEAMRLSRSFAEFRENLRNLRYRSGIVAFESRNHFFSDWKHYNADLVEDVTSYIADDKCLSETKKLNEKEDGTYYITGIPVTEREITYIPSHLIDGPLINKLRSGDYLGIYSTNKGLDVSHAGIFIRDENSVYLRHASSVDEYRKVIDQDLNFYIKNKPGIIVLRPKG